MNREVVRANTPGTAMGINVVDAKDNNYLAAVAWHPQSGSIGLAYVDLSTGEFCATEFAGESAETGLRSELEVLRPREPCCPNR